MDPAKLGHFLTKVVGTVPLFNGSVPYFACSVNGPPGLKASDG